MPSPRYETFRDRCRHVLRCGVYRYFPAIDHDILRGTAAARRLCAHVGAGGADRRLQPAGAGRRLLSYCPGDACACIPRKTLIAATRDPAPFPSFILLPGSYRRLPEDNVRRFRNRRRGLRMRWRLGSVLRDSRGVERRAQAWIAAAEHADSCRLRQAILCGGWYDPPREGLAVPGRRAVRGVRETSHRGNCARRIATGTTREP